MKNKFTLSMFYTSQHIDHYQKFQGGTRTRHPLLCIHTPAKIISTIYTKVVSYEPQ